MGKSIVIKIIFAFVCLCIIPFILMVFFFNQENQRVARVNMEESVQKLVDEKAQVISLTLGQVEKEASNLSLWLLNSLNREFPDRLSTYYQRDDRGVLGRKITMTEANKLGSTQISSIYLPSNIPLTSRIIQDIEVTENLDMVFSDIIKRNSNIEWVYIVTNDGFMRVFPYLSNNLFSPTHEMRSESFFVDAIASKNPKANAVWTKPYYDYAGKGWVVTCSQPLYIGGKLRAVVCLDVSLKTIEKVLEDFRLAKSGFAFLIDNEGNIIYHPQYIPSMSKQGDVLKGNLLRIDSPNGYKEIITSMVTGMKGISEYKKGGWADSRVVAYAPISGLNWSLGIEVNPNDYILSYGRVAGNLFVLNFIMIIMLTVFGAYLFVTLSKPLLQLAKEAKKISEGEFGKTVAIQSNDEIGVLTMAFNTMSKKINEYTQDIIHSKKQLESVVNSIGGLLMILDSEYHIIMTNRYGTEQISMLGYSSKGSPCYVSLAGHQGPCSGCPVSKTLLTGKEAFGEVIRGKDIYHVWSYPTHGQEGVLEEIVVYSKNVTEEIVIQQELAQTKKLAGLGQLAAGVTHELKNPLGIIKGAVYLLRSCSLDKKNDSFTELIEEIDENVARAERIIFNLLDFSRSSKNKAEEVDVRGILEQVLLLERASIIKQGIDVEISLEPESLSIFGLIDSFKHIFLNIINNAVSSMPTGGKLLITGCSKGKETELSFSDTGCGISEDIQDKVFQPFFTTKGATEGTGLGLWIVRREVEKNHGKIFLESIAKQGTTFKLIFPSKEIKEGTTGGGNTNDTSTFS